MYNNSNNLKSLYLSNKDYPGNESFTIFLIDLWYFSKKFCLVTPGNPQRCNSMIAKRSIQLNFYVGLFTLGACSGKHNIRKLPKVNLHVAKLEIFQVDCLFLFINAFKDTISNLGLTFTLYDCKPPVPVWFINFNFIVFG